MQDHLEERIAHLNCKFVGLYRVVITEADLADAFSKNPQYSSLGHDYLLELLEQLYVFDLWFSDIGVVPSVLMETTQDNDAGQAPWSEAYYDASGWMRLFPDRPLFPAIPETDDYPCRVLFFMHYVDPDATLDVAGHHLKPPSPSEMPDHFKEVMIYNPPN